MNFFRFFRNHNNLAQSNTQTNPKTRKRARTPSRGSHLHGVESLESRQLLSVNVEMLDINTNGAGGVIGVRPFDVQNQKAFFFGQTGLSPFGPARLWTTDATEAGTAPVSISPSFPTFISSSAVGAFVYVDGSYYFRGTVNGEAELWKTDGTVDGTVLIMDINPTGSSTAFNFVNVNGTVFFFADDGVHGFELWKTDGTSAGTVMVKDIFPGASAEGVPNSGGKAGTLTLTNVNGTLYFAAVDDHGLELWKSDGTTEGTVMVKDINPNIAPDGAPLGGVIANFTNLNGTLLFAANDGVAGIELWRSDGTADGTRMVKDINTGAAPSQGAARNQAILNGALYFLAVTAESGSELWKTDGTEAGTTLVKDINPGAAHGVPTSIYNFRGTLLFNANNGVNGAELWRSDGTEAGTMMVSDMIPGAAGSAGPPGLTFFDVNGVVYFSANTAGMGVELWKSDGTAAGTQFVAELFPGPTSSNPIGFYQSNGTIVIGAAAPGLGRELFVTDGTSAGTKFFKDVNTQTGGSAFYPNVGATQSVFVGFKDKLFFGADTGVNAVDWDLWQTDGTQAGTSRVKNLNANGRGNAAVSGLVVLNDQLFFYGSDAVNGLELWRSDGTDAGTAMVKNINPAAADGVIDYLSPIVFRNEIYFAADSGSGLGLWRSDGTAGGTVRVKDISIAGAPVAFNDQYMLVVVTNPAGSTELWRTDGTDDGTTRVKDIGWVVDDFTNVNGTGYFSADDGIHGTELWKTDGTEAGTVMVADINPGAMGSEPNRRITSIGNTIYFFADDGVHGRELWKSDGSAAGTTLVADITPANFEAQPPGSLTRIGTTLYFRANDGIHGQELWKSDGTLLGTTMVADINQGAADSLTANVDRDQNYVDIHGALYFAPDDGVHGRELWKTDGTTAGTVMVADVIAGAEGSDPDGINVVNDRVYFTGRADFFRELFTFKLEAAGTPGDFNGDRVLDIVDINDLASAMQRGTNEVRFDMNSDRLVDQVDRRIWVEQIMRTWYGDADLDGDVDMDDFLVLSSHFSRQGTWGDGDFNGDNTVGFSDFLELANNFGKRPSRPTPTQEFLPSAEALLPTQHSTKTRSFRWP